MNRPGDVQVVGQQRHQIAAGGWRPHLDCVDRHPAQGGQGVQVQDHVLVRVEGAQAMLAANQSTHRQLTDLKALPTPKIGIVRRTYNQNISQFENFSTRISRVNGLQILPRFLGSQGHRTPTETHSSSGLIGVPRTHGCRKR